MPELPRPIDAKLVEGEVIEIRRLHSERARVLDLASAFEVSPQNVEAIVHRRSWRHLP